MGKVRVCDGRCHKAQGPKCDCWCGGLFHGGKGAPAREAFAAEFGALIATEDGFEKVTDPTTFPRKTGDAWRGAIAAAQDARLTEQMAAMRAEFERAPA